MLCCALLHDTCILIILMLYTWDYEKNYTIHFVFKLWTGHHTPILSYSNFILRQNIDHSFLLPFFLCYAFIQQIFTVYTLFLKLWIWWRVRMKGHLFTLIYILVGEEISLWKEKHVWTGRMSLILKVETNQAVMFSVLCLPTRSHLCYSVTKYHNETGKSVDTTVFHWTQPQNILVWTQWGGTAVPFE